MAEHKGLTEFTGDETSNIFLGQGGFDILAGGGGGAEHDPPSGTTYWVALKTVDTTSDIKARSYNDSDDLTLDGSYSSGGAVSFTQGDIVYGCFDKVHVSASDIVIAYRGK